MVSLRSIALFSLLGIALLLSFFFLQRVRAPGALRGTTLTGDSLLEIQIKSDFDRDGSVGFKDFTFLAAFWDEE